MRKLSNRDTKASSHKDIIHGRLIVRFKPSAVEAVAAGPRLTGAGPKAIAAARAALPDEISGPLDYLRDVAGVKSMTPMFVSSGRGGNSQRTSASLRNFSATHEAVVASAVSTRSEQRRGFQMLELKSDKDAAKIIKKLQASKAVDFVEEVPNRWLCAAADPMINRQWGLRATGWFNPPKHPSLRSHV